VVSQIYTFPEPGIETAGGITYVHMTGLPEVANPGEPLLPIQGAKVLLPPGEVVVEVEAIAGARRLLPGKHRVAPGQKEYPLSRPGPFRPTEPDPLIYGSPAAYPPAVAVHVTTERANGCDIAFVRLYPVEYTPSTGALAYYESLELRIHTAPSAECRLGQSAMFRGDAPALGRVARLIDNPGAEHAYVNLLPQSKEGDRSIDTYPYLIITDDSYVSILQDLADFKTGKGIPAKIVRVDSLTANVAGNDDQDKIRNYIIEAYQNLGTEYVLLAGDDEFIPHRGFYDSGDYDIASDLYYGALDGNWNTDGDSRWGEPGEADLIPEVHVGRMTIDNPTEAMNIIDKTLKYQQDPVVSECAHAMTIGELLWDDPTWGGDYMEEIRLGASTHGHTTVGFPNPSEVDTLYDRGPFNPTWDLDDLIPILNTGMHQVHHLGHSNVTYCMRMVNSDVESRFTNDGDTHTYFIVYTQGCYDNSFDNRWDDGSYGGDAIAESFTGIENGAVAFIGNTRYGYGAHESTNGSSQRFHRQYVDALYGEGIYNIGVANSDSKVDAIPFIDMGMNRWCYYEINLLGDPEMLVWTDTPVAVTLTHDGNCWVGQNEYEVLVESGRGPVADALVCLRTADGDVYAVGTTNESGRVYLDPSPTGTGTGTLVVSAHNHLTTEETVTIQTSGDPFVICSDTAVDDDDAGSSSGDGDGTIEAGEIVELSVELQNVGETQIADVFAILASSDTLVQVLSDSAAYGTLPADGSAYGDVPYLIQLANRCPDGHEIELELTVDTGRSHGVRHLFFETRAPRITLVSYEVVDTTSGNGNGCVDRTEDVDVVVTVTNSGSDMARDILGTLLPDDPNVTYVVGTATADSLDIDGTTDLQFQIFIEYGCPAPYFLDVPMELSASAGEVGTGSCEICIPGPLSTDFEDAEIGYWTHEAVTDGYVDEWFLTDDLSYGGGAYSWKCGGDPGNHADYADGGLRTPFVCLTGSDTLECWHRMRAEQGSSTTAWDGGFVEISVDGGAWQQITPLGGYTHTIIDNPDSPFAAGTPCWSGLKDWAFAEFDLDGLTGPAQFRFRFGSDGYTTYEGWWVDEVVLRTETITGTREDVVLFSSRPSEFALAQNHPNPFNPVTTVQYAVPRESHVSLTVYNILGQQVRCLVDGTQSAGFHEATWDGRDDGGRDVASGIYFCRMNAEDFSGVKRMILLK